MKKSTPFLFCVSCGTALAPSRYGGGKVPWCSPACKALEVRKAHTVDKKRPSRKRLATCVRQCLICQDSFKARRSDAKYCSDKCRFRAHHLARRAKVTGVAHIPWFPMEIADRDDWICYLCGDDIDKGLAYPDRRSLSIDHVIPLSAGGDDAPHNVRAAHLECNWAKGPSCELEPEVEDWKPIEIEAKSDRSTCVNCGKVMTLAHTGRPKRFCGQTCRKAWSRRPKFPEVMTSRRSWVRADGKRPIEPSGAPASSIDPGTWHSFAEVQHGAGDGLGIMLGDGLGCYDLDDVTDEQIRCFVSTIREPIVFVERSVSGGGAHVFVEAPEGIGWKRTVDGISVERYTRARFIRTTGKEFVV